MADTNYDICLSFAGEDRPYVEEVARALRADGVNVFYDVYEEAELWGKDLYQHLADVYQNRGKYCVVFLSESYARKLWTRHELRSAQARAFKENREYILPARFDDTELPGLPDTVAYVDLRGKTPEQLSKLIAAKLSFHDLAVVGDSRRTDDEERFGLVASTEPTRHGGPKVSRSSSGGVFAPAIPTWIVLWLQWVVTVFLLDASSRSLGLFALVSPIWLIALALAIGRVITRSVDVAWWVGGVAGAVIGPTITFFMHHSFVRYGLVVGAFFSSCLAAYVVSVEKRTSVAASLITTLILVAGLGVFEYYDSPSQLLLPSRAYVAAGSAAILGLLAAAVVQLFKPTREKDGADGKP